MAAQRDPRRAGNIAFTYPDFAVYELARFLIEVALEMQSVAVGWQVYEITKRPLDLGLVGLAQFLPGILLFLVTGHVADRFDRRKLLMLCYCAFAVCSGLLWEIAVRGAHGMHPRVYPIFAVPVAKYRQVEIANLKTGRHGKHHDLVQGIVQELTTLRPGSALEIPLSGVGGIGLANLRSAVHRAAVSNG